MEELFNKLAEISKNEKIDILSANIEQKNGIGLFEPKAPDTINLTLKFENSDSLAVIFKDIIMLLGKDKK